MPEQISTAAHEQEKIKSKPRKKNDIIFKGAFEEYFIPLLRFIYPNADQIFDFDQEILFMNNELAEIDIDPDRAGGITRTDLLAKVFLKDGTEKWFYLHTEIQVETNAAFPERIFDYYIRLRDKYGQAIVSLAVFAGKKSQLRPNVYQTSLLGTELNFKFYTYQIFDHTEDELLAMDNPFALVVIVAQQEALCRKLNDTARQNTRMKIIVALVASGKYNAVQIKEFVRFLNKIIIVKDSKYNIIFDKHLQNMTGGTVTMGLTEALKMLDREEGIEIGIKKTEARKNHDFVENLIVKFGFSDEQVVAAAEVSINFVKKVRKELEAKNKGTVRKNI
ncbi:UDP-N-acetylglucosamine transferase subunit ALG13 [Pedobacter sp. AK017]|uniref:hypothetical protein n=1 Tax=Pedobacter sp. AK017 TaxID=2723073 RepID=UPI00160ADBE1|nr:hypothetical protein [Pedobacter sp. AK017]MBB5438607.1 UDP-N-acetylglucosamine transferase subunit ALG13 [Pedobacter sp. AK017]